MSEQELNSYRFTSGEDPSDEMLAAIMKGMAANAENATKEAEKTYWNAMRQEVDSERAKWVTRINRAING